MTLKEAEKYIALSIHEGYYSPEYFDGMTDEEKIKFAEEEGARGDHYANGDDFIGVDYYERGFSPD